MDQQPPVQAPMPNTAPTQPTPAAPIPPQQPIPPSPVTPPPPGNQPMQPPTPTAGSQTPAQLPAHNSKKVMMIVLSIIILIALGVTAYFMFFNKPAPAAKTAAPTVTKTVPTPTPDPTANWETYTNTIEGFSFKYPPGTKLMGDSPISSGKQILGQRVDMQYNDIDFYGSVQKVLQPVKQGTESATINGQTWYIEYQPKPSNCSGMGLGPCTSSLQYNNLQGTKLASFYFTNTSDRQWAEQIISTFQFVTISPSAAPSTSQSSPSGTTKLTQ